jgi:hypothetical protein
MMQLTEYHFDKATSVRRPLMLNLAAAALRVVSGTAAGPFQVLS